MSKKLNLLLNENNYINNTKWKGLIPFSISLISELNMKSDIPATPAIPATPVARRRRYSRVFTSDRIRKLYRNAKGQFRWRKVPTIGITFYGKRQRTFKDKEEA